MSQTHSKVAGQQFFIPFYTNTMKCDRFLHILRFLHFTVNMNQSHNNDHNYITLCKMGAPFVQLNDAYVKFYSPSEHLTDMKLLCSSKGELFSNNISGN